MKALASLALLLSLVAPAAEATVIGFDDLTGEGVVSDGYGGVTWGGDWSYYDSSQDPYNPSSPNTRIYTTDNLPSGSFSFATDVVFGGAYIAGFFEEVIFELFLNGSSVAVINSIFPTNTPTLVGSGYAGLVDEVRVSTTAGIGYFVLDDVTYTVSAIPVPAAGFLLFGALGGLALLRRRKTA